MRFKDYIVNKAIETNYYNIKNNIMNTTIDNVFINVSNKLGYKILDKVVTKHNYPCDNKEWKIKLDRHGIDHKRYLEWDTDKRQSVYFDEKGYLYYGNGRDFNLISPISDFFKYNKYKDFLDFVKKYFENNEKIEKEYVLIDYNKDRLYYLCSDTNIYYKKYGTNEYYFYKASNNNIIKG